MLIGELARLAGVKAQTVRYYETMGLLSPVQRSASGYRTYGPQTLEELRFIRKAQSLGFSLDDVKQVLDVARAGCAPCARVLAIAEKHLADLDLRIRQLSELRNDLARAVNEWRDGGVPSHCASTLCGLITDAAPSHGARMSFRPAITKTAARR
jgi:MerR family copper efflux transcriptional regulator